MRDARLKEIASVRTSNVDKKSVDSQEPVQLCNYTDVYYHDYITPSIKFMSATATRDQVASFTLQRGDVLLTKDSETSDDIAVPALVTEDLFGVLCGYHLALVRPHPNFVDSRFLHRALSTRYVNRQFQIGATGVTRYGLRTDVIRDVRIPFPDLEAQRLISDFLDRETHRIDALVDAKRRMIERLKEKREALTLTAATGSLDHNTTRKTSVPWAPYLPDHWREALLNKVARMGSGHTPSRSHPEWWENATIPWVTTGEVHQIRDDRIEYVTDTRENISFVGLANSAAVLHPENTVFLSRTASAGFSGIMGADMATSQDFVTWTCGSQIEPRFLLLCLRAMRRDLLERLAQGSTHKTIYMPDIASIKVPLPPLDEQRAIVDRFWRVASKIDVTVDGLSNQLNLLAEYRQALITQAVTGQLDEATLKGDRPIGEVIPE